MEDESKRKDRKLEDAQRDLKVLEREKERLNDDVKREVEKRLSVEKRLETAQRELEQERGVSEKLRASEHRAGEQYDSLRRERDGAVGSVLDGMQAKLDELRRTSNGSSNGTSSQAAGAKRRRVGGGEGGGGGSESSASAVPVAKGAGAGRRQTRSTQSAAAAEFASVPETLNRTDSLGLS